MNGHERTQEIPLIPVTISYQAHCHRRYLNLHSGMFYVINADLIKNQHNRQLSTTCVLVPQGELHLPIHPQALGELMLVPFIS